MRKGEGASDTNAPARSDLPPSGARGSGHVSLEGVHGSVEVPHHQAGFWEQWRAFVGPAILGSGRYMEPGHWGADPPGGAPCKYGLPLLGGLARLLARFMQGSSPPFG